MRPMFHALCAFLTLTFSARSNAEPAGEPERFAVTIQVNVARVRGSLPPIWRFFGADEPNYAYMKDGRKLLADLGRAPAGIGLLPHPQPADHRRRHAGPQVGLHQRLQRGRPGPAGLRLDDRRPHLRHLPRARRAPVRADRLHAEGALRRSRSPTSTTGRPTAKYDEIYTGWAYPPKDYAKWGELVYQWAKHCVERYGRGRGGDVVLGDLERGQHRLLARHARGVPQAARLRDRRRAAAPCRRPASAAPTRPAAAASGRATSSSTACAGPTTRPARSARRSTSSRSTPRARRRSSTATSGWGSPTSSRTIDEGFRIVASFPELKSKPIVIGESDPEGCAACQGPQLGYRNGTMYSSYTAASFARKHDLAERARREPRGRADLGLRVRGPAVLRRVPRTGDKRHRPAGAERLPDVQPDGRPARGGAELGSGRPRHDPRQGTCAIRPTSPRWPRSMANILSILAWHYHDDDVPGPDAEVALEFSGLATPAGRVLIHHYRVDRHHSNAYETWTQMGSPQHPTPVQYAELVRSSRLALLGSPEWVRIQGGVLKRRLNLPRQAVSLLRIELHNAPSDETKGK